MPATTALSPDQILRDLAKLWVTLGKQGEPETGMGVLRACSLNLVVVAPEDDDFQALGETVAALMPEHPARTILIHLRASAGPELSARVFSQCWMPFGQRRQICCEQIEVTASERSLKDALSLVAAVTAPDLPVIAWSRSVRLFDRTEFRKLAQLANRVVVDTSRFPDSDAAVRKLADVVNEGVAVGDLSWTRLTRWREMVSQSFENRERLAQLPSAVHVVVEYGGKTVPVTARYMGAWLAESLKSAGCDVGVEFAAHSSAETGRLSRVELTGDGLRMDLRCGGGWLGVEMDGLKRCASDPASTDYSLMREELGIVRRDAVFERALRAATAL